LQLLDGTPTNTLDAVVDDVERVMRRAVQVVLAEVATPRPMAHPVLA